MISIYGVSIVLYFLKLLSGNRNFWQFSTDYLCRYRPEKHQTTDTIPLGDHSRTNIQDRIKQMQNLANLVWQQWVKMYL